MKALLIAAAIVSAWISGAGSGGNDRGRIGAVVFLVIAMLCGVAAWSF